MARTAAPPVSINPKASIGSSRIVFMGGSSRRVIIAETRAMFQSNAAASDLRRPRPLHVAEVLAEREALEVIDHHALRPLERGIVGGLDAQRERVGRCLEQAT